MPTNDFHTLIEDTSQVPTENSNMVHRLKKSRIKSKHLRSSYETQLICLL